MGEIKRADFTPYGMVEKGEGHYVYFTDHEAEVARLRAELNAATKAGLDAIATICEKEREADELLAEVEGLREVAMEASDFLVCLPGMSQNDTDAAAAHLINKIDAAMGEGK